MSKLDCLIADTKRYVFERLEKGEFSIISVAHYQHFKLYKVVVENNFFEIKVGMYGDIVEDFKHIKGKGCFFGSYGTLWLGNYFSKQKIFESLKQNENKIKISEMDDKINKAKKKLKAFKRQRQKLIENK